MRRASFVDDLTPFLAMEVMERGMAMTNAGAPVMQLGVESRTLMHRLRSSRQPFRLLGTAIPTILTVGG